eukprot:gene20194-7243_t
MPTRATLQGTNPDKTMRKGPGMSWARMRNTRPRPKRGHKTGSVIGRKLTILPGGETASKDVLKTKYKELVMKYHPDVTEDKESAKKQMEDINQAYHKLMKEGGWEEAQ